LLVLAVVVPTACVLWFMHAAVRNERMAVRQKLADAYGGQLEAAARQVDLHWQERAAELEASGGAESGVPEPRSAEWEIATALEFARGEHEKAAMAYARVAQKAPDAALAARALQGQARCLAKAGRLEDAVPILTVTLADDTYREARSPRGRLIAPNALLMALELMAGAGHPRYDATLQALSARLADYGEPLLPPAQRRFLMLRLREVAPEAAPLPTLAAEELANEYLETGPPPPAGFSGLWRTALDGVWRLGSPDGRVVALLSAESIAQETGVLLEAEVPLTGMKLEMIRPGQALGDPAPFLTATAGERLPGWRLALLLEGDDPFRAATGRQTTLYLWTGFLVVAFTAIIALLVGRHLLRQVKLTRLKNDFIATVTHELKTPLAAMRVLVDTLLDGHYRDQQRAEEYLRLVSKENERLSRLIDNFLTFSRMERNKQVFELTEIRPAEIVEAAADVVRSRFEQQGCRLDVKIAPDLPTVVGDRDALVTVALNLLDNAFKYSENERQITVRLYSDDSDVCFEVEDNGIGLSPRAVRRIFERFYQVDSSLSRSAGGCGLGLSIVKFIVDAHGGSVGVTSRPGEGSVFRVKLPAVRRAATHRT
jgi:signal transduction histidine kinase